ncbi:molybdopterin-dependent oxidoreductase [Nakamurella sp. YIM 132087]|uniref:Molybdopterin-dependent oxidoreductase n=1 Tax=Nakamurella alba TaxID=2665158 RepID=A0A7K1FFB7_9ACTN|nr:xanthine dehydrogenase family protein molybdopterin-binding subunit [Nakamurella alba]MTD12770.1 molybdopterin-dependent oxidoreductase [Nakamurella alba]
MTASLIGAPVARNDAPGKITGTAVYGIDHREVGMAHGAVLRSPVPAGRIVTLDTSPALEVPGVIAVLTAKDQPDLLGGWVLRDQPMLAVDEVRFEGEAIALVIAETREIAKAATTAIVLEIDEWPGIDMDAAIAGHGDPEMRLIHPDWASYQPTGGDFPREGNLAARMFADPPGVDEAFARAAHVVEDTFTVDRQYQAYMEPKSGLATWENGRCTLHTSTQYPFNVRDRVAQYLGMRSSDVRAVGHVIGGGFGGKLDASVEPLAALGARAVGQPLQIRNDREEDILTCPSRENAVIRVRTALDADGVMIARDVLVDSDNGAYSGEMPGLASLPLSILGSVYEIHGPVRVDSRLWYTNTTPTGAFRGVGGLYLYMSQERHMDHIAATLGVDRREYRLRHLFSDGSVTLTGQVLPDASLLAEAFELMEQTVPWEQAHAELGPNQGIGISAGMWMTNPMPGSATVKVNEDGVVQVISGANDNGSGSVSMGLVQIVAETMGVRPDQVVITMPDTDVAGYDGGSQGSRTTHSAGRAARDATADARKQLLDVASGMLEVDPADLLITDGRVEVAGVPERSLSVAEVATAALYSIGHITATSSYATPPVQYNPSCADGLLFPGMATPSYHVHLAVVEIDPVTGGVKVIRYVIVQETGRVINPVGFRGQVQGGVTQAIGYALQEQLRIGPDCRYLERNLHQYRIPLGLDLPDVEIVPMEHPSAAGPFGALGVAEPPITFAPAAIANAVSHALGRACNSLPITPERVLDALVPDAPQERR